MTDIPKDAKCSRYVLSDRWGVSVCCKPAKMEHDGKFYCGRHDPVKRREKRDATSAKWNAELEAERAKRNEAAAKQAALEQDAARYRWLTSGESGSKRDDWIWDCVLTEEQRKGHNDLHSAIDAAMKA